MRQKSQMRQFNIKITFTFKKSEPYLCIIIEAIKSLWALYPIIKAKLGILKTDKKKLKIQNKLML